MLREGGRSLYSGKGEQEPGDNLKVRTTVLLLVRHGHGEWEPRKDFGSTGIFVVPLEGAGLFCHHKQPFFPSCVERYLGHCMENLSSSSFINVCGFCWFFFFFSCFWVLSEKSLLSTVDLWLPVFEDLYLNKDYFPSSINGERCDLGIVVQVAKIISACLVAPSFEVSRFSRGCM